MRVCLTESRDRIPLDRERWNALASANPVHTVFQTYEWFDTWWSAFGARYSLCFLTFHDGDEIVGFAPLMRVRGAFGMRRLEFTGTPNADYQDLVLPCRRAEAVSALCEYLHQNRRSWDMIVLRNVPADSPTVAELGATCVRLGLGSTAGERQPCPAIEIRGREGEVRKMLDRYSIRRALRRLERRGPLSFHRIAGASEIDRMLPEFFDQHVRRWQASNDPSPFLDETFRRWYRELAISADAAGWLHFSVLRCGGRAAAFHFGFCHGDTLHWYKPSYEPELSRDSPGTALIHQLIEDAERLQLGVLDFSAGREPFKLRFSNSERECLNLRIFPRRALYASFQAGAHARRLLRACWHRLRALRAHGLRED